MIFSSAGSGTDLLLNFERAHDNDAAHWEWSRKTTILAGC
jgi:hypothetical protein